MLNETLIKNWIADDPAPSDQAQLQALLTQAQAGDDAARADLDDRFSTTLKFGTAGLRGRLGAGPNRMNRAVVIRAAAGIAAFLQEKVGADFSVVIGYDARYGSEQFARDTAAVMVGAGGKAWLLPSALPTPVLAFALRHLGCDGAIMVTASHNPPQDNGYKVYLGGRAVTDAGQGAQIVSPADSQITAHIEAVTSISAVARAQSGWEVLGPEVLESYLQRVSSLVANDPQVVAANAGLRIVLTSMHGVGGETCLEALGRAGFSDVHVVSDQHDPDPDFPTVAFPNPEEPGALDLSIELARQVGADLILANDPDADRCSAAIVDPSSANGWRQLAGDEVGWLLGAQAAQRHRNDSQAFLASSIVSSRLLGKIAAAQGLSWTATLTGFKWISRVPGLVFGYEEALGYCVDPGFVRDKDGISACLQLATLAAQSKALGQSLQNQLDQLAYSFGVYATAPLSVRVEDLSIISRAMATLRGQGIATLAGSTVVRSQDLLEGLDGLPPTDGMLFLTADDSRVIIRPSGTEPKLKCYLEVVVPLADQASAEVAASSAVASASKSDPNLLAAARQSAQQRLEAIKADLKAALGI